LLASTDRSCFQSRGRENKDIDSGWESESGDYTYCCSKLPLFRNQCPHRKKSVNVSYSSYFCLVCGPRHGSPSPQSPFQEKEEAQGESASVIHELSSSKACVWSCFLSPLSCFLSYIDSNPIPEVAHSLLSLSISLSLIAHIERYLVISVLFGSIIYFLLSYTRG